LAVDRGEVKREKSAGRDGQVSHNGFSAYENDLAGLLDQPVSEL
jgi:hypothetical protein